MLWSLGYGYHFAIILMTDQFLHRLRNPSFTMPNLIYTMPESRKKYVYFSTYSTGFGLINKKGQAV